MKEATKWVLEARELKDNQILDELSRPECGDSWNGIITKEAIRRILFKMIEIEDKILQKKLK